MGVNDQLLMVLVYVFFGVCLLSIPVYLVCRFKGWVHPSVNHYTGKAEWTDYWDFLRVTVFFVLTVFAFIQLPIVVALLVSFLFLLSVFVQTKKKGTQDEQIVCTVELTDDQAKKSKERFPSGKKVPPVKLFDQRKVVFTSHAIYFSARKKIQLQNFKFQNIYIRKIRFEGDFVILTHYMSRMPMYDLYVFVPKSQHKQLRHAYRALL